MATLLTHAYVGLFLAKTMPLSTDGHPDLKTKPGKFIPLVAAACAMIPDLDVLGFSFGIPYGHPFGHRGFSHSLLFAALLSFPLALIFSGGKNPRSLLSPPFKKLFFLFFLATFSHPFLDALTNGGLGVAFFAPMTHKRFFFPWTPIEVSPIGLSSFLSWRGLVVLMSELVVVILPLEIFRRREKIKSLRFPRFFPFLFFCLVVLLFFSYFIIAAKWPTNSYFYEGADSTSLVIELNTGDRKAPNPNDPSFIPTPGNLLVNLNDILGKNLLNRRLEIPLEKRPWSSSFFPSWYGGVAGRWQDSRATLALRTITGISFPSRKEAINLLHWSSRGDLKSQNLLFRYSPTEKYDLAVGHYDFPSSKLESKFGHNQKGWVPFWYGYCDGLAVASILYREPFRKVRVINPDGFHLEFHPNDIKALLAKVGQQLEHKTYLGVRCNEENSLDEPQCRDINPATLVIALVNKLGIEQKSFLIEIMPFLAVQNFPLIDYRVDILSGPRPIESGADFFGAPRKVKKSLEVRIELGMNSTNIPDYSTSDLRGHLERVEKVYTAQLGLDDKDNIIGGKWTNPEETGPDFIWFIDEGIINDTTLEIDKMPNNEFLSLSVINKLHQKSIEESAETPTLDLRVKGGFEPLGVAGRNEKNEKDLARRCEKEALIKDCDKLAGWMAEDGKTNQAIYYYTLGCDQGYDVSCFKLGGLFKKEKKMVLAKNFYGKACRIGSAYSCNQLGQMEEAEGSLHLARKYYKDGCDRDSEWACYDLAVLEKRTGNLKLAKEFYKKSCQLKHGYGCMNLGELEAGEGKMALARKYYNLACERKVPEACLKVSSLDL